MGRKKSSRKRPATQPTTFVIDENDNIGTGDADNDFAYLDNSFVNERNLDLLVDTENVQHIILGRTGSGKTALIKKLSSGNVNYILLDPASLSLNYIYKSTIIQYFDEIEAPVKQLFEFLWIHIFTVEILRHHLSISDKSGGFLTLSRFLARFRSNSSYSRAKNYVDQFGDKFWQEVDENVQELISRVDARAEAKFGINKDFLNLRASGGANTSEQERRELNRKATELISGQQFAELDHLRKIIREEFSQKMQKKFFILIDRLDENWVDDKLRYILLRSLIEAARKFVHIPNLKICIAIRSDLYRKMNEETNDLYSQADKEKQYVINIRWTEELLEDLIDARIKSRFREKYRNKKVSLRDLLPSHTIDGEDSFSFIVNRTFGRPRDLVNVINLCLSLSRGKAVLTQEVIRKAVNENSYNSFKYLCDEWKSIYPNLKDYLELLKKKKDHLKFEDISNDQIDHFALNSATRDDKKKGPLHDSSVAHSEGKVPIYILKQKVLYHLYLVGVIGFKTDSFTAFRWVNTDREPALFEEFQSAEKLQIHKAVHLALGISP
ncbi:P-loop ATPase, Sll1717 family [Limibacillus halophilus]